MKCYFCQREMLLDQVQIYVCDYHPVNVYQDTNSVDFVVFFRDRSYNIIFYFLDSRFQITDRNDVVIDLSFLPNITPSNYKEKLPTILTFL